MREIKFYHDKDLPFFELKIGSTNDLSYKKHAHEEYSVGIVNQGTSRFWYDGQVAELQPNTMVFIPPNLVHACNPVNQNQWNFKMLYVNKDWVQGFRENKGSLIFNDPIVKDVSENNILQMISKSMESLKSNANPLEKEASILTLFEQSLTGEKKMSDTNYKKEQPKLRIIKGYLQDHFLDKITLNQLEQVSGLSKFNIIRLFKRAFKIAPHTYQTLLRVNYAKKELGKHRRPVEIALEAGFYDQSHFIKVFRDYTGITPDRYQKFI